MKRTKNMIYKETVESRELFLYTVNDGYLYEHTITYIIKSLEKKAKKGIYDKEKAIDAYYKLATAGSNKYYKDFGYKFNVQDRFTAACDMEDYYKEQVFYNIS
jgi:hypothetical protein